MPTTTMVPTGNDNNKAFIVASSKALIRTLLFAKVKFVRYLALDVGGNVRCKVIPLDFLQQYPNKLCEGIALVKVCIGGLPSYADVMLPESGLTAAGTLVLRPDLESLRILPYAPSTALVLGSLTEGDRASDVCCRSLLCGVLDSIRQEHKMKVAIGVELEFNLFDAKNQQPVDGSNFADTTLLNQQQAFIDDVYSALRHQDISIELLHSESAHGQMEIVLQYKTDPVLIADHVILTRETIRAVAHQHSMKALFLPKVSDTQAGNGCHLHISLCDASTNRNVFGVAETLSADDGSGDAAAASSIMSSVGQSFLEGILVHLPAIMAVTMPTINSFRRVGPGCWTGSQAIWAIDDKEAPLRVISGAGADADASLRDNTNNTRVEYKLCDSMANIYLAMSVIFIAGMNGIEQNLELRSPGQTKGEADVLPKAINEALNCLETSELLPGKLPPGLLSSHLAIRRAEVFQSGNRLVDEVEEAWNRA